MKIKIHEIFGHSRDKNEPARLDVWSQPFLAIPRHLSQISPTMNFAAFSRHAIDAICQSLSPLNPCAAHFHIDVSVSHLWLPDPTFKLDSSFRIQNRIILPVQGELPERSNNKLFQTHVIAPFEMHRHAVEILVFLKDDPGDFKETILSQITQTFQIALSRALLLREEYLLMKEQWERTSQQVLALRLSQAIYQTQSHHLHAHILRSYALASDSDASEHIFLSHSETLALHRFLLLRFNCEESMASSLRKTAFVAGLTAQLRLFKSSEKSPQFPNYLSYFTECISSLSHLLTDADSLSFVIGEYQLKTGHVVWHSAGMPLPGFIGSTDELSQQSQFISQDSFNISQEHAWDQNNQLFLPENSGLFFVSQNVARRLRELEIDSKVFFERLKNSTHASQTVLEAEKILSQPQIDTTSAEPVNPWTELPYDVSFFALFNAKNNDET